MTTLTVSEITENFKQNLSLSSPAVGADAEKPKQPDIEYHPDRVKWEARTARRLQAEPNLPKSALPKGFPKKLESPLVWEGKDWKEEKEWVYELNVDEVKEIDDAVNHFHGQSPWNLVGFVSDFVSKSLK